MLYTNRSIFLTESEKKKINFELSIFFNEVLEEILKINPKCNLYLSGSLARGEPSIKTDNNSIYLLSDIDFVIVNKDEFDNSKFKMITEIINKKFPKFQSSFVVINESDLKSLKSFFARDLSLSFDNSIFEGFKIDVFPSYIIDQENYIEALTTQIASFILHPYFTEDKSYNVFFRSVEYHWMKSILECLRFVLSDEGIIGYNDPIILGKIDSIKEIVDINEVKEIVKARELCMKYDIQNKKIYSMIYNMLCYKYKCVSETELLFSMIEEANNQYKYFQYSILFLFMFFVSMNDIWLIKSMNFIKKFEFTSKKSVLILLKCFNEYIGNSSEHNWSNLLTNFRKIRNDYVEALHKKNTCETIFTDKID